MTNYYDEILTEIENLIKEGKYGDANFLVQKELNMPYIPIDVEQKLKSFKRELNYHLSDEKEIREDSLDSLLRKLKGKPKSQLAAASILVTRNLRECLIEIKDYLSKDPCPEAAALLIEGLAEQEISDEFTLIKNGVEYTFWSDDIIPVHKSEGFLKAQSYLKDWLENDHPDFYEMAKTLLIHEVYVFLPLSYDEDEAEDLALAMLKQVSDMMDEGEIYQKVSKQLAYAKTLH